MVQKYQNEIPPIFYYGISTKTNEKDLKIPNLQALTLGRIIKMTLYNFRRCLMSVQNEPDWAVSALLPPPARHLSRIKKVL